MPCSFFRLSPFPDYAKFPGLNGAEFYEKKLHEDMGTLSQADLKREGK
jgi:hypothetical protein